MVLCSCAAMNDPQAKQEVLMLMVGQASKIGSSSNVTFRMSLALFAQELALARASWGHHVSAYRDWEGDRGNTGPSMDLHCDLRAWRLCDQHT